MKYFFLSFFLMLSLFLTGCENGESGIVYSLSGENGTESEADTGATEASYYAAAEAAEEVAKIYVSVQGEVINPGVYIIPENTRVYEAINAAGGLTDAADIYSLNVVDIIYDGQQIYIPAGTGNTSELTATATQTSESSSQLININTASKTLLETLPGIGSAKAQAIIDYRETNGSFTAIEDVMNVTGIKEGVYEKIKEYITVR